MDSGVKREGVKDGENGDDKKMNLHIGQCEIRKM